MPYDIPSLIRDYTRQRAAIRKRLAEFGRVFTRTDEEIFAELCFCILTPQSKAVQCDKALTALKSRGYIMKGCDRSIAGELRGKVRFHNKKAAYIVGARKIFRKGGAMAVKARLDPDDVIATRDWIVTHTKGVGYKEASHFLRNIGLGKDIAILDRHILKNLKRYGALRTVPASFGSRTAYMALEEKARSFCKKIGIPLEELDLLFWSAETGYIFK
jgi:N-glycosylase/DNA lyase